MEAQRASTDSFSELRLPLLKAHHFLLHLSLDCHLDYRRSTTPPCHPCASHAPPTPSTPPSSPREYSFSSSFNPKRSQAFTSGICRRTGTRRPRSTFMCEGNDMTLLESEHRCMRPTSFSNRIVSISANANVSMAWKICAENPGHVLAFVRKYHANSVTWWVISFLYL